MSVIDDITAKFDANKDGKLSIEDLEALKTSDNADVIDQLKEKADQNGDGKLTLDDLKAFDVSSIGDQIGKTVGDLKDKLFGGK